MGWDAYFELDEQGLTTKTKNVSENDVTIIRDLVYEQHGDIRMKSYAKEKGRESCMIIQKLGLFKGKRKMKVMVEWWTAKGDDGFGRPLRRFKFFVEYL